MGRRLISLMVALTIGTMGALAFAAPSNAATPVATQITQGDDSDCLKPQVEETAGPALALGLGKYRVKLPCRQVDYIDNCDGTVLVTVSNTADADSKFEVRFRIGDWHSASLAGGESDVTTIAAEDADGDGFKVESRYPAGVGPYRTFDTHAWSWNASCLEITAVSNCDTTFKVSVKNIGVADGEFAWQLGLGELKNVEILKGQTLSENFNKGDIVNIRWGKEGNLVKTLEFVQPKGCATPTTAAPSTTPPVAAPTLPVTGASMTLSIVTLAGLLLAGVVTAAYMRFRRQRTTQ